ncbi:MAG: sigma-70 family RNA polymerase sigma factor [Phycisphaeraceae bacterium]|nr:sigma-70 family RNA polymerase sigma factor [Phycisphaeraceae bacterium]
MMGLNEDFEQIAMTHLTAVYKAAVAVCGNKDVAEDIAQTTLLKAYERFDSFEKGTNCKAWLLSILRNTWIDHLRSQKRKPDQRPLEEDLEAKDGPDETVWSNADDLLNNFSDERVIWALQRLPDEQRLTLFLIDVEQLSQEEVAEITGVAVGTVKSRASRARSALKMSLAAYAKEMNFMGGES